MLALYDRDVDIPHLTIELQMLPDLVKTYESNHNIRSVTNVRTIAEVLSSVVTEEVRQGQKVNVICFSLPTSGMVFSRSLGDF